MIAETDSLFFSEDWLVRIRDQVNPFYVTTPVEFQLIAVQECIVAGLPLVKQLGERVCPGVFEIVYQADEGARLDKGALLLHVRGPYAQLYILIPYITAILGKTCGAATWIYDRIQTRGKDKRIIGDTFDPWCAYGYQVAVSHWAHYHPTITLELPVTTGADVFSCLNVGFDERLLQDGLQVAVLRYCQQQGLLGLKAFGFASLAMFKESVRTLWLNYWSAASKEDADTAYVYIPDIFVCGNPVSLQRFRQALLEFRLTLAGCDSEKTDYFFSNIAWYASYSGATELLDDVAQTAVDGYLLRIPITAKTLIQTEILDLASRLNP